MIIMVGVAQLVELRIVIPAVVGSSPIVHPNFDSGSETFRKKLRAISSIGRAVDS